MDDKANVHREAMAYAMQNDMSQLEVMRLVYQNAYKYYQIAVEVLDDHREFCEQLEEVNRKIEAEAEVAAAEEAEVGEKLEEATPSDSTTESATEV